MKKRKLVCMLVSCVLLLTGCGGASPESTTVPTSTEASTAAATTSVQETEPSTEADKPESGSLYLTVSKRVFSLQGESEDIYCGSAPREDIIWGTADDTVATVENGIVTAVGVGETTVYAEYGSQRLECVIGCLAKTQEELDALPLDVLHSPIKYAPVTDGAPCAFYDDAVIIGDSVSHSLMLWATMTGEMGKATFLVRGGNGINGYVKGYKSIGFQGVEHTLEDAVALSGAKKAFIMLGVNDLGYMTEEETIENLGILIDRIREKSPEVTIYLESCLPVWEKGPQGTRKANIDRYNEAMIHYAQENDCVYVEVGSYVQDHTGGMAEAYCSDFSTHMNYDGTDAWMQALKTYAVAQG